MTMNTIQPSTIAELLPRLASFGKVVVTGPQRSGTTIAAEIIGAELGIRIVREETFREDDLVRFAQCLADPARSVIQAPALSSVVHLIKDEDIAVIFMVRDTASIQRSELRINWQTRHEAYEKAKYLRRTDPRPISEIKYAAWEEQSLMLGNRAFALAYDSLQQHPLFVPAEHRRNFSSRQTSLHEPNPCG
jgi:hypothetical protein